LWISKIQRNEIGIIPNNGGWRNVGMPDES